MQLIKRLSGFMPPAEIDGVNVHGRESEPVYLT